MQNEPVYLSLVVPCYNEQEVIETTHRRLGELLADWRSRGLVGDAELIYVDDGSSDTTPEKLRAIAAEHPDVKVIRFSRNFGHQSALLAGLHNARGEAVVTLDADLQDPPETVEAMLEKYRRGFQCVYGVRSSRTHDSFFKRFTARGFYRLMRRLGVPIVHDHADFRLAARPVVEALKNFPESNLFLRGLFPAIGFPSCEVKYERPPRAAGETKYPFHKMLAFALRGITSFSYKPLRIATWLGMIVCLGSLGVGVWAIVVAVLGRDAPAWAPTLLPLYFLIGVQMLLLGILGEYLGRVFLETKRRPPYIIQEILTGPSAK